MSLHYRNTTNIGDKACCPADYFQFIEEIADNIIKSDFRKIINIPKRVDMIIWGGGSLGYYPVKLRKLFPNAKLVAWGVGITGPELTYVDKAVHKKCSAGFTLYGSRDFGATEKYVPCASCMSSAFDMNFQVKHEAVVYGHKLKKPMREEANLLGIPYMDNHQPKSLVEVIKFLSSAETIITSSYHGAYWGTLLGKNVAMLPFGRKFFNLKYVPEIVESVQHGLRQAKCYPDALNDARSRNVEYAQDVYELIMDLES